MSHTVTARGADQHHRRAVTVRQASCVAIAGRALLIEGAPGSGKTSLALALIDRGAQLIGDDGVTLQARGNRLWASPPPNIEGLLEVRNVGIARLEATEAPVALRLLIADDAPRFVESASLYELEGCEVPSLAFYAGDSVAAIRAEYALQMHGLATET